MVHIKFGSFASLMRKTSGHFRGYKYLIIGFLLCFSISLIFCLNEFPTGSDIPSHYIKIMNMQKMLEGGKIIRWSYDWYCGYAIFNIYPPLFYFLAATLSLVLKDIALVMKIFTIISFSSFPILIYKLGRVLGRTYKGATAMALLFSLTPLNIFFLFNGYFVFILSLPLMFLFLIEFFKYSQNRDRSSFLVSTVLLTIISMAYHRTLYFIIFILGFYFLIKAFRRQLYEAVSTALITTIGIGISSFWLLPAIIEMMISPTNELYQGLIMKATFEGISFHIISMLFIIPYCYLALKKIRKGLKNDFELTLLLSLVFFTILALGPIGLLHYIVPFSTSQRPEITLLIITFIAIVLGSTLFDEGIKDGRRTFYGILSSSLIFLIIILGVFFSPKIALGLQRLNFKYSKEKLNDSLINLINNAYVKQQIFLGKNDEEFLTVLKYLSNDNRTGRVAFYSNRSQTVDMFYYYAMLPLSGKSTPQGIAPEGEGDLKWDLFTKHIIWDANETLLKLAETRWIISNYPLVLNDNHSHQVFGQYILFELYKPGIIKGCEYIIHNDFGNIHITLLKECKNITFSESYHPRWRAFDQDGNEVKIESTEYGFMKIMSKNELRQISLIYSNTIIDFMGIAISIMCVILLNFFYIIKHGHLLISGNHRWA